MFDPKDLIDIIIAGQNKGTAPMREGSRGGAGGLGGLGDIMSDILGSAPETRDTYQRPVGRQAQREPQAMPDLGDIFGDILGGAKQGSGANQRQAQQQDPSGQLKDIFDQMTRGRTQRQEDYQQQEPQDYGRGMGSGMNTGDILGKAKDILIANPTLGAVVLGGLGSLVLGSKSGRSLIGKGIKLGGAAMVGKMAWNAYKKYSEGQMAGGNQDPYRRETHYQENRDFDPSTFELPSPIEQPRSAPQIEPELLPAPKGSGFEEQAQTGENAILLLRTMIAASATDGEVDREERKAIIDNLKQLGLDQDAMSFIEDEFNNPATVAELAREASDEKVAAQVYTAARITIHPDTRDEVYFLQSLAEALKLPAGLVANIDYAANAAKS